MKAHINHWLPDLMLQDVFMITPSMLKEQGIRALALDIDNTLAPYSALSPDPKTIAWLQKMTDEGIICFVISNNKYARVAEFCQSIGTPFACESNKPSVKKLQQFAREFHLNPDEILVLGDQIFTDVWMAKRYGCRAWMVDPIDPSLEGWLIRLKRILEKPFIYAYRRKH